MEKDFKTGRPGSWSAAALPQRDAIKSRLRNPDESGLNKCFDVKCVGEWLSLAWDDRLPTQIHHMLEKQKEDEMKTQPWLDWLLTWESHHMEQRRKAMPPCGDFRKLHSRSRRYIPGGIVVWPNLPDGRKKLHVRKSRWRPTHPTIIDFKWVLKV